MSCPQKCANRICFTAAVHECDTPHQTAVFVNKSLQFCKPRMLQTESLVAPIISNTKFWNFADAVVLSPAIPMAELSATYCSSKIFLTTRVTLKVTVRTVVKSSPLVKNVYTQDILRGNVSVGPKVHKSQWYSIQ